MMYDNSVNFYTVCQEAEKYFKTIDRNKKGSGWKPFQRWKVANEYKYYPSGNRSNVDPSFVYNNYVSFNNQFNNTSNKLFNAGWEELGPLSIDSITGHYSAGLGRIEDMHIDPINANRIYLGSRSGGFWRSTDGGITWSGGSTDFLPASGVNTLTASATNPDSVLINVRNSRNGYSHGIYRSIDGGVTFTQSNFNPTTIGQGGLGSSFSINQVAYHPRVSNLVFVLTNKGIYRSTDNLQTWSLLYSTNTITKIAFHPTNNNIIYIYNYSSPNRNNIFISTDQGISYTASATIAGNSNSRGHLSTSTDCDDCVYFASTNGVWRSTDSGQNFTFLINPNESCLGFAVNDLDTSEIIYGYVDP